jgi:hypothetical protein
VVVEADYAEDEEGQQRERGQRTESAEALPQTAEKGIAGADDPHPKNGKATIQAISALGEDWQQPRLPDVRRQAKSCLCLANVNRSTSFGRSGPPDGVTLPR